MSKNKIRFGCAGIPQTILKNYPNSDNSTADGVLEISNLNLSAFEIEFVRGVYLKNTNQEKLSQIKKNSIHKDIKLSAHGPYYINLNAKEKYKIKNSVNYIVDSLLVAQKTNIKTVLFHPAYFLKQPREKVLKKTKENIIKILDKFEEKKQKDLSNNIRLGLELTGKKTQVGSLEDILYFYEDLKSRNVIPVFDFAHVHARYNGYFKDSKNLNRFFSKMKSYPKLLKNIHCHMSGIKYTKKGERSHLMLENSDFPYKKILRRLKDLKAKGTIICESPIPYKDALLMKKEYEKI